MLVLKVCACVSLLGVVLLSSLGAVFIADYRYLQIGSTREDAGFTCIRAASLYILCLGIITIFILRKRTTETPVQRDNIEQISDEDDEEEPLLR